MTTPARPWFLINSAFRNLDKFGAQFANETAMKAAQGTKKSDIPHASATGIASDSRAYHIGTGTHRNRAQHVQVMGHCACGRLLLTALCPQLTQGIATVATCWVKM